MPLSAKLVVVGGEVKTAEIELRLPSTIGRGRGSTIMLPHPLVSRQHCELFESGGQLMVRDLGSLNGTFVNNQRVTEAPLPPNELLTIGTVTFRAVYELQSSVSAPSLPSPHLNNGQSEAADPNGTVRAGENKPATGKKAPPKSAAAKPAADATALKLPPPEESSELAPSDDDDEEIEFNFDQPLYPVDETVPTMRSPGKKSVSLDGTEQASRSETETEPAPGNRSAVPKPAAARPIPAKPIAPAPQPVDAGKQPEFANWDDSTAPAESEDEDDDLNDFLKGLGGAK